MKQGKKSKLLARKIAILFLFDDRKTGIYAFFTLFFNNRMSRAYLNSLNEKIFEQVHKIIIMDIHIIVFWLATDK